MIDANLIKLHRILPTINGFNFIIKKKYNNVKFFYTRSKHITTIQETRKRSTNQGKRANKKIKGI